MAVKPRGDLVFLRKGQEGRDPGGAIFGEKGHVSVKELMLAALGEIGETILESFRGGEVSSYILLKNSEGPL